MGTLILAVMCVYQALAPGTTPGDSVPPDRVTQAGFSGNEANAIAYVATTFRIPVVAETIFNSARIVNITAGEITVRDALNAATQGQGERWELVGKAVHIYTPHLVDVRGSFLSYRFATYNVEGHPSAFAHEMRGALNAEIYHAAHPAEPFGVVENGIVPFELDENWTYCIPGTFTDISARELLLKEVVPARLAVIMLYPDVKDLTSEKTWSIVSQNWFWLPIDQPARALPTLNMPEAKASLP